MRLSLPPWTRPQPHTQFKHRAETPVQPQYKVLPHNPLSPSPISSNLWMASVSLMCDGRYSYGMECR